MLEKVFIGKRAVDFVMKKIKIKLHFKFFPEP